MQSALNKETKTGRAIRLPRVCDLTGASHATVWRWVNNNVTFPKPFHLSVGITCWDEAEVMQWIADKKAERRTPNRAAIIAPLVLGETPAAELAGKSEILSVLSVTGERGA